MLDPLSTVLQALEHHGMLLAQDGLLPSVVTLVVGSPVAGSWWAHPRGGEIYATLERLEDTGAVLATKLVKSKITFLHRSHWEPFLAVAMAGEAWQLAGLSVGARALLSHLEESSGAVMNDGLPGDVVRRIGRVGAATTELEARLLVATETVHTDRGRHARRILRWTAWAAARGVLASTQGPAAGRAHLERLTAAWGAASVLPWQRSPKRS
jgi:hypothetical protein